LQIGLYFFEFDKAIKLIVIYHLSYYHLAIHIAFR